MGDSRAMQLSELVDENDPVAVGEEAFRNFSRRYGDSGYFPVAGVAGRVRSLFAGGFLGYHACDTGYHDLRHTLSVFLASSRLLDGRCASKRPFAEPLARNLLLAALCHDTGYIRRKGEEGCTGAFFTARHVERSIDFLKENASSFGLSRAEADCIARLIMATGLKGEFATQDWASADEREAGAMLASADLIGQMADRVYLEKLLFLYYEFREAGFPGYDTEFDILRKTMDFYELMKKRLDGDLGGVRAYAVGYFKERLGLDRDLYAEAMERQMDYLRSILADDSTNFRKKLKRLDLESVGAPR